MVCGRKNGLYGLFFLPGVCGIAFSDSEPTATVHGALLPNIPEPTLAPAVISRRGLRRRDDEEDFVSSLLADESSILYTYFESAVTTVTTSWVPQSVCGYIDAIWDEYSSIRCQNNWQCVFHTPDSNYPGMVACCDGSNPQDCAWQTTCYDSKQVSETPSVLNYPTNKLAIYCTETEYPECRTWVYPQLDITDYGCHYSKTLTQTLSLIAISTTQPTGSGSTAAPTFVYYDVSPTVAAVKPSIVDASWIDIYVSGTAATSEKPNKETSAPASDLSSTSESKSETANSAATDQSSSDSGSGFGTSPKSTNTPVIIGGVVGGVLGAAGIAAAGFMFFLSRKKRKQAEEGAYQAGSSNGGSMPPPPPPPPPTGDVAMNMPEPMHEVEGTTPQKYAEVDGYGADSKLPSEVQGSEITRKPYEIDSRISVAELSGNNISSEARNA